MSLSHLIILGVIALIVIPPEKLPELARQLAKMIYELKRSADQVLGELKQDAIFKPEDILDKNIKEKFADIKRGLDQDLSQINQGLQGRPKQTSEPTPSADVQPTTQAWQPKVSDEPRVPADEIESPHDQQENKKKS